MVSTNPQQVDDGADLAANADDLAELESQSTSDRMQIASGGGLSVEFITGPAGTGKTYEAKRRLAEDSTYGVLTATTGIAAVNLSSVTVNSILGYFNLDSLEESFYNGWLERRMLTEILHAGKRHLLVDEISMMHGPALYLICQAARRVNEMRERQGKSQLGIVLTGDFCQLPPIPDKDKDGRAQPIPWAFKSECWPEFAANTTRLNKIWRQDDPRFLEAINLIRSGRREGAMALQLAGVEFTPKVDFNFDGTTIVSLNKAVNSFNEVALSKVRAAPFLYDSYRWGKDRPEWKNILPQLKVKVGAYVMVLTNEPETFSYVNGDCGHVVETSNRACNIELIRTGEVVSIPYITRPTAVRGVPDELAYELGRGATERELHDKYSIAKHPELAKQPHWNSKQRRWILGGITFMPVQLAYASTVHKSQGLSLDKVQVDCYNAFFGQPAMAYVAISRCRTPQGLRIVGTPALLAQRINTSPDVKEWL